MEQKIQTLMAEVSAAVLDSPQAAEAFRLKFTARKGVINDLFEEFRALTGPDKARFGKPLNELKQLAAEKLRLYQESAGPEGLADAPDDLTLPGDAHFTGSRHPIYLTMNKILAIFERAGFSIADGPEIEDDWHNFTALNMPEDHPARDMQDTFFISEQPAWLLRTHTSNVQIRVMERQKPPIRILAPGRVYRNETISARAHCFFHQIEGLYIDKGVSFPDLVQLLNYFAQQMFGEETKIRLRPSYFPFTEISAEMDVSCFICGGRGCTMCKSTGWVEILGCGMVDPAVLKNCGIDPEEYSGFAWGMGIERCASLLYRVPDLRIYSQNDIRFLNQFRKLNP